MNRQLSGFILYCFCLFSTTYGFAAMDPYCPYFDQKITQTEIDNILKRHREWLGTVKQTVGSNIESISAIETDSLIKEQRKKLDQLAVDDRRAILCKANLSNLMLNGVNLTDAILYEADLTGVAFSGANLTGAALNGANLTNATLFGVDLSNVALAGANLTGATLAGANLTSANLNGALLDAAILSGTNLTSVILIGASMKRSVLFGANLTNAKLHDADLTGAELKGANLTGAILYATDLSDVFYETKSDTLPVVSSIALAKGLSTMRYKDNVQGLVQLRKAFSEAGFREKEREITRAIKHNEAEHAWEGGFFDKVEGGVGFLFFEFTTEWGMNSGKALLILLYLIFFFFFFYIFALYGQNERAGIWRYRSPDRPVDLNKPEKILIPCGGFWKNVSIALYFSFLSAFHFGWRDLNVGNWIVRMQFAEYTLRPTGWVRTVAGIQSLISVYLVAIWALTYFGRPFE